MFVRYEHHSSFISDIPHLSLFKYIFWKLSLQHYFLLEMKLQERGIPSRLFLYHIFKQPQGFGRIPKFPSCLRDRQAGTQQGPEQKESSVKQNSRIQGEKAIHLKRRKNRSSKQRDQDLKSSLLIESKLTKHLLHTRVSAWCHQGEGEGWYITHTLKAIK